MKKKLTIRTREEILQHLQSQKASSSSMAAYCRVNSLSYTSFRNWKTGKTKFIQECKEKSQNDIFKRVNIQNILPSFSPESKFELEFNTHKIFIPQEFSGNSLKKIIEVLKSL